MYFHLKYAYILKQTEFDSFMFLCFFIRNKFSLNKNEIIKVNKFWFII